MLRKIIDKARTLAGVRRVRHIPAPGSKPSIGTSIVRDGLRMRIKYPIDDAMWEWLCARGWRAMHTPNNRRYHMVPEKVFLKLLKTDTAGRLKLDAKLAQDATEHSLH